jgi:hypothetical protein
LLTDDLFELPNLFQQPFIGSGNLEHLGQLLQHLRAPSVDQAVLDFVPSGQFPDAAPASQQLKNDLRLELRRVLSLLACHWTSAPLSLCEARFCSNFAGSLHGSAIGI